MELKTLLAPGLCIALCLTKETVRVEMRGLSPTVVLSVSLAPPVLHFVK